MRCTWFLLGWAKCDDRTFEGLGFPCSRETKKECMGEVDTTGQLSGVTRDKSKGTNTKKTAGRRRLT